MFEELVATALTSERATATAMSGVAVGTVDPNPRSGRPGNRSSTSRPGRR
jgi:hypothetical protein